MSIGFIEVDTLHRALQHRGVSAFASLNVLKQKMGAAAQHAYGVERLPVGVFIVAEENTNTKEVQAAPEDENAMGPANAAAAQWLRPSEGRQEVVEAGEPIHSAWSSSLIRRLRESGVKRMGGPRKQRAMGVIERHTDGRSSKFIQDLSKKSVVQVHMNGFLRRRVAFPFQGERNAVLVEVGVESRRTLKGPDVKLVRIFDRHLGFVGNGLVHGVLHASGVDQRNQSISAIRDQFDLMQVNRGVAYDDLIQIVRQGAIPASTLLRRRDVIGVITAIFLRSGGDVGIASEL